MTGWLILIALGCGGIALAGSGWLRSSRREGELREELRNVQTRVAASARAMVELARPLARGRDLAARMRNRRVLRDDDAPAD